MKYILLIRHGDALPPGGRMDDFDRPLSNRGKKECILGGKTLKKWFRPQGYSKPDQIFCSPSLRTRETADMIRPYLDLPGAAVIYEKTLYLPEVENILEIIWGTADKLSSLAFCSHNPGISSLAHQLFGFLPGPLPTGGILLGEFEVDSWSSVIPGSGVVLETFNP